MDTVLINGPLGNKYALFIELSAVTSAHNAVVAVEYRTCVRWHVYPRVQFRLVSVNTAHIADLRANVTTHI